MRSHVSRQGSLREEPGVNLKPLGKFGGLAAGFGTFIDSRRWVFEDARVVAIDSTWNGKVRREQAVPANDGPYSML
jgi:hypothetical protein